MLDAIVFSGDPADGFRQGIKGLGTRSRPEGQPHIEKELVSPSDTIKWPQTWMDGQ